MTEFLAFSEKIISGDENKTCGVDFYLLTPPPTVIPTSLLL